MANLTIQTTECVINGQTITYTGRGSAEIASQEDMAKLMAGENGSIAKFTRLKETFTRPIIVLLGSPDDSFLQDIVNSKKAVSGYIKKGLLDLNGNFGAVQYDIENGVLTRSPGQTDNITLGDVEAESVTIFNLEFVGKRRVISA